MLKHILAAAVLLIAPATAAAQTPPSPPPGTLEYYHVDALGSVRAISNASGQVIATFNYHPFGEGVGSEIGQESMRFTGKPRDAETGLDYFGARHYVSRTGRFTTVDPLMAIEDALVDPQRWNRYAYVLNNPLKFTDPDGRNPLPLLQKLAEAAQRAASSPAVQRAQQAIVNQGSRAWVAVTRLFNTPGGREAVQNVAEFVTGVDSPGSPAIGEAAGAIGAGHALSKHADDFAKVGVKTAHQAAEFVQGVILGAKAQDIKPLREGRFGFFDNKTGFVVIIDPKNKDFGTAFIPDQGREYFDKVLK